MFRLLLVSLFAVVLTTEAVAQNATRADSVFARARRLVNEGAGTEGRALIDSLVRSTKEGSAERADALYWRAALAPDAATAQRDYVLITVDHSLTPRAADALLGLAQLEYARGDRAAARRHLERLVLEHPQATSITEAWYWLGRTRIEIGDVAAGCQALDSARKALPAAEVERRNMVDYAAQSCRNRPAVGTTPPAPTPTTTTATTTATRGAWTVQVAAFKTKAEGERLVSSLKARGHEARVIEPFGAGATLYRVRIGFYATRADAVAVVATLKAQRIGAIVAETEAR
jgi:cell division septation protein DedD